MIETDIYNHLKEQVVGVDGRVYPLIMPQNCLKPALVYTVVNSRDHIELSGCMGGREVLVQIDIYAPKYIDMKNVMEETKKTLHNFKYPPMSLISRDLFEEDTELYRGLIEFKFLSKE
jgi:hypothetical protein